jgi:hypothetical protein
LISLAPYNRSVGQLDSSKTLITEVKSASSSKKPQTKQSSPTTKGNKLKPTSNTGEIKSKRLHNGKKIPQTKKSNPIILPSTGLSSKTIEKISTPPVSSTKTAKKSVTNAVISYLHHRGAYGGYMTGRQIKYCMTSPLLHESSFQIDHHYIILPFSRYG